MSRPSLAQNLARAAAPPEPLAPPPTAPAVEAAADEAPMAAPRSTVAPARQNKTMIAGYFSQEMGRAVKILAVERGVTVQALLGEALDDMFRKSGKHPLGER